MYRLRNPVLITGISEGFRNLLFYNDLYHFWNSVSFMPEPMKDFS